MGAGQGRALALYIHIPWCVRKCPYCDFNSHAAGATTDFALYVERLLVDLDRELLRPGARRPLSSVFIGGGTPSLMPSDAIADLLSGVRARTELVPDIEITLEANPGTVDNERFEGFLRAGVNRLSIGVQSLMADQLIRLGRIHDPVQARAAVAAARAAGFDNLNLDLMFALPGQTLAQARDDLAALISLGPEHISYYQLTLEPHTAFYADPPSLPDGDLAADMSFEGQEQLAAAGYRQYEVSAFARPGRRCRHNLNYWRFGDYLGIGAGAHGKLSDPVDGSIRRYAKHRHPDAYLAAEPKAMVSSESELDQSHRIFEFALNAFRLVDGFERSLFEDSTGVDWSRVEPVILGAIRDGLLIEQGQCVEPTVLGRNFTDLLVSRFLDIGS